jgi:putative transposase
MQVERAAIVASVRQLRGQLAGAGYGVRRLQVALKGLGLAVGRDRLRHMLAREGLLFASKPRRLYVQCTQSRHPFALMTNLAQGYVPDGINQLWVADTTFLSVAGDYHYLALLMDGYSRRVVGYALADRNDTQLTLEALAFALRGAGPGLKGQLIHRPLIHHSDRGGTYCSHAYRRVLGVAGLRCSNTQSGNPRENGQAERLIGILKNELKLMGGWPTRELALAHIAKTIGAYNHQRLHSALGYKTPAQVHPLRI